MPTRHQDYAPPVAGVLVAALLGVLVAAVALWSQRAARNNLELESVAHLAELRRLTALRVNQEALVEIRAYMLEELADLQRRLPARLSVPGLLEDFRERASLHGIALTSLVAMEARSHDFFGELPIVVEGEGEPADVYRFIADISAGDPHRELKRIDLARPDDQSPRLRFSVHAHAHFFIEYDNTNDTGAAGDL